ncbi:hypothetical protein [Cardinium endosymbiont of Nabis limbatus]|uniref:hypothetical protein n=1 Tax=Cardinium endosymbiont of Nabis limbatus TaxID=3066217 RepID=UPI003AF3383A
MFYHVVLVLNLHKVMVRHACRSTSPQEERDKRAAAAKAASKHSGIGQSTLTVLAIDESGQLESTILGDSKAIVVRGNDILFETEYQADKYFFMMR